MNLPDQCRSLIRHRESEPSREPPIRVELAADDPLRRRYGQEALVFRRTQPDVAPTPGMQTFRNESAAWWRGNQLYGNDQLGQINSISDILTGQLPSWRKGSFSGFNATLSCGEIDGSPYAFEPVELTYLNRLRQTVHVR